MHDHGAGDGTADVLQHKGLARRGKQASAAHGIADFCVSEHVDIGRLHQHLISGPQREVVQDNGPFGPLAQVDVALDVPRRQRVFKATGNRICG